MNKEEIIEMARQADIDHHRLWNDDGTNRLETFAKLVAEKELEACAKVCEQHGFDHYCGNVTDKIAKTIRARGNHDI